MDYMIIFNEKLRSYKDNYEQLISIIEKILKQADELHRNLYKKDIRVPEINEYIKLLIDSFEELDNIKNILFNLEQEFNDVNVRIKRDFPDYKEEDLIDVNPIKARYFIKDLDKKRIPVLKLSKSLELYPSLFNNLSNITPEYTKLSTLLNYLNDNELVDLSSKDELEKYNNNFLVNTFINTDNSYLLEPTYETTPINIKQEPVKEDKKEDNREIDRIFEELNKKPTKKIIIEKQEGSVENYEIYLANKYDKVGYKTKYDGVVRLPYPHEEGQDFFINDYNEQVIISKNYADNNYYKEIYLPYVRQNNVGIEEVLYCINDIKNRIYNTIAKSLIAKSEPISEEKFNLILRFICDNKYNTRDYLKYKIDFNNGEFCLNILYKNTKVVYKLEYSEMLAMYDEIYNKLLPRIPIFNPETTQTTIKNNTIYSDDNHNNEFTPEIRNKFIRIYLKQKLKNWKPGRRYESIGDIKDTLTIDIYTANGKIPIEMNRIEKVKVI